MSDGTEFETLRDTALSARPNPNQYGRAAMLKGWVTQERIGKTGARVTKFAFGSQESTKLVVLSQQPGHDTVAGLVHDVESYQPPSPYVGESIRFDRGRPLETADAAAFTVALAAQQSARPV